ncbi:MAG: hypothetical protein LBJ88_01300 [Campylobacteraceae bacterium]|jgi:hypothetical protein|nr:hypothetical protein [Campylobacteraceae bacterium]
MNKEISLKIVYEKLIGFNSIPISIREMRGVNIKDYQELKCAIEYLIEYYNDKNDVPKKLALAFVDISNYFFVPNLNYSEKEHEKLENYGIELSELANKLFSDKLKE